MIETAGVIPRSVLAHEQIADGLCRLKHPAAYVRICLPLRHHRRGQHCRGKMPPTRLRLEFFQPRGGFSRESRLHPRHSFLEVTKIGLLRGLRLRVEPAIEKRAP